ncbi:outer membrane protein transport protein [Akkermansiaceae bacterium]|nr:outer membrane protein transport protein [Akkermansiaceae bacterium]MDB4287785.1 outer membrane protein transport protein [bacterium]MDB4596682.1 outer membrane protein transport protein [Akkermansiaceae bacterium]MDB4779161.1 outer membrane protein transport protein [bacterium]MDB4817271.1 outer membrane protein transport protein [Akkermansiaceae bacterium]
MVIFSTLKETTGAFGYNVGILFELSDKTRFGLHYRSAVDLSLNGTADIGGAFAPLMGGASTTLDASLEVELPDTLEFSAYHELNDKLAIHADVLWTGWSKFQELAPITNNAGVDSRVYVRGNWSDAFRFSVGATYKYSDRLTLRAGAAYDESPASTPDRTLRIPDADRIWLSIGGTYVINESYNLDFGFTHILADDATIVSEANGGNEEFFQGKAEGVVNLFAIGISGSF